MEAVKLASAARGKEAISYAVVTDSAEAMGMLGRINLAPALKLRLRPLFRAVKTALADYEAERLSLCKALGKWNAEEERYVFGDKQATFDQEFNRLRDTEVDLSFDKIKVSENAVILNELNMLHLDALDWLLDFDGAEEAFQEPRAPLSLE